MKRISSVFKYSIAFLIIAALLWAVDTGELWKALSQLTPFMAFYLILISVLLIYMSSLKWKLFLESYGKKASLLYLFHLYLVGYFVNLLLPSHVGGDAVRSWYVGKKIGQHEAAASTILERYTGFVAMIILAFLFVWGVTAVPISVKLLVVVLAGGLVTLTVVALSPKLMDGLRRVSVLSSVFPGIEKVQQALRLASRKRRLLLKAMLLSFLFHTFTVVNTYAAAAAVGWHTVPVWELFVVLPIILLIGVVPLAPNGLGLQEGAFYFFLPLIGATPAQALGVALILRAKSYVLAVWGGVIWLFLRADQERHALAP